MDWTALQAGLKDVVAATGGIAAANVSWDGEPERMRGYPMATLEVLEDRRDGHDELRQVPDADGRLVPVVYGHRLITLQVTLRSRDQRGNAKASSILSRLRTRLELPEPQAALDELGVVLRDTSALRDVSAVIQQREESGAQLSITLGYTVAESDEQHTTEPIESVQVSGEVYQAPAAADGGGGEQEPITVPETTFPEEAH